MLSSKVIRKYRLSSNEFECCGLAAKRKWNGFEWEYYKKRKQNTKWVFVKACLTNLSNLPY